MLFRSVSQSRYSGANNTFWSSDGSGFAYNSQANQKRKQKKSIEHGVIGDNVKQERPLLNFLVRLGLNLNGLCWQLL